MQAKPCLSYWILCLRSFVLCSTSTTTGSDRRADTSSPSHDHGRRLLRAKFVFVCVPCVDGDALRAAPPHEWPIAILDHASAHASAAAQNVRGGAHGVIASINSTLQPLSGFGVLSLLLPFLLVDVITVTLLSLMDPWLLITPWDSPLADLLLPLGMEFFVVFCSFPLMALAVNKKMEEVQRRVRGCSTTPRAASARVASRSN